MKSPKIFHCRTRETGPTTPVTVRFTKYSNNQSLTVQLVCARSPWPVFATATVNLDKTDVQDENHAFLDINNYPWVEKFLLDNGIAKSTGITGHSGYCHYPLYEFDKEACYEEK